MNQSNQSQTDAEDYIYRAYVADTAAKSRYYDKLDAFECAYRLALDFVGGDESNVDIHGGGMHDDGLVVNAKRQTDTLLGGTETETQQFIVEQLSVQ